MEVITVYTSLVMGTNGMLVLLVSERAEVTPKVHRKSAGSRKIHSDDEKEKHLVIFTGIWVPTRLLCGNWTYQG